MSSSRGCERGGEGCRFGAFDESDEGDCEADDVSSVPGSDIDCEVVEEICNYECKAYTDVRCSRRQHHLVRTGRVTHWILVERAPPKS